MKYVRTLGLLAVVAAATMAFAASASADTVTTTEQSTGGATNTTPTIHLVNVKAHISLANPIATILCLATIQGTVTSHEAVQPVFGHISILTYAPCTNSWHVTTVTGGTFSIEASNGEVKSSGTKIDTTRLGVTCVYETSNTKLGTLTGGSPATLHVEASIPINSGESSGLCGSGNAKMEGAFVSTHPLHLDNN